MLVADRGHLMDDWAKFLVSPLAAVLELHKTAQRH
jgi:hypothetical protein